VNFLISLIFFFNEKSTILEFNLKATYKFKTNFPYNYFNLILFLD
jgi:hypothetical protein